VTQYPECILARELGMCYVNISLITDYDVGLEGNPDIPPVTNEMVIEVFKNNNDKLRGLLYELIGGLPDERGCGCSRHLQEARMG
jgi:5'-methylthioadenosine phosphorylase